MAADKGQFLPSNDPRHGPRSTDNNSPHGDTMTLEHLDRLVRLQSQVLSDMAEAMTNLKDAVWALNEKVRVLEAREGVQ